MSSTLITNKPRPGVGQFWSNTKSEREVWVQPVEERWFQLAPFFRANPEPAALSKWLERRWDGMSPFCSPGDMNTEERALGLACGIRGIPERVADLLKTLAVPNGMLARDIQVEQLTRDIHLEVRDNHRLAQASHRLADNWAVTSATTDLGEFEQNLASMIYFIHLLLIRSPQYFATGRNDTETRTPRMYALTAVLATPLVAFKERNFRASRGNFSWSTLSTFCHWFECKARSKLPKLLQDLEQFMWVKIRNYIWEQYMDQPVDAHTYSFKQMVRNILSTASVVMTRLGYEKHVTPLLTILPLRRRFVRQPGGADTITPNTSTSGARLEEVPNHAQSSTESVEPMHPRELARMDLPVRRPLPASTSHPSHPIATTLTENTPHATMSPPQPDNWRESLVRQFGGKRPAVTPTSFTRKRANSVDASSSRIDNGKRIRPLESFKEQAQQVQIELPVFAAEPGDREIVVVSDDDIDADDGRAWFDYLGPDLESRNGEHPQTCSKGNPNSDPLTDQKKGGQQAGGSAAGRSASKRKTRSSSKKGGRARSNRGEDGKSKSDRSNRRRKRAKSKQVVESTDEEDDEVEFRVAGPWQGPVNIEPFDGGIGLPDEQPLEDEEPLQREERLFPGPVRPTDEFWQRRVRGVEFSFFQDSADPVTVVAFGSEALADLAELQAVTRKEWEPEDVPESITEIPYGAHDELLVNLRAALSSTTTCRKVIVVRGAVTCPEGSFEDTVRPFAGYGPMECQIPGILYADGREELHVEDMFFSLLPDEFFACARKRSTGAVNWLSGTTEQDSDWLTVVRRLTVDFRAEWERTSRFVANGIHPFPGRQANFTIAALPGAYSGRHIDAGGFGTVVEEHVGHKIWWILLPDPQHHPAVFKDAVVNPLKIDFKYWKVHAIRLWAGDLLLMPPGTVHCVLSTEPCLARGGHFLHDNLLSDTVAISLFFSRMPCPPTNAFHNGVLQMFVARRVQRIMERWQDELRRYCRSRDRVKWAGRDDPIVPAWPENHPVTQDDLGMAPEWFALLYLVRHIAPSELDHPIDGLPFAAQQLDDTVEKSHLFVEFWTKRVRSLVFAGSIEAIAQNTLTCAGGEFEDLQGFPEFWQPEEGEDYPPSL